jgi:DNA end-binding protein Ku
LTALIDAKATGRTLTEDDERGAASVDLLAALRASIEAAKQRRSTADNGGRRRTATSTGAAKKKQKKPAQAEGGANVPKKRG